MLSGGVGRRDMRRKEPDIRGKSQTYEERARRTVKKPDSCRTSRAYKEDTSYNIPMSWNSAKKKQIRGSFHGAFRNQRSAKTPAIRSIVVYAFLNSPKSKSNENEHANTVPIYMRVCTQPLPSSLGITNPIASLHAITPGHTTPSSSSRLTPT